MPAYKSNDTFWIETIQRTPLDYPRPGRCSAADDASCLPQLAFLSAPDFAVAAALQRDSQRISGLNYHKIKFLLHGLGLSLSKVHP